MKIKCSECGKELRSLIVGKEAIGEVMVQMAKHLPISHPKEVVKLRNETGELIQLATWYLSLKAVKVEDIPENQILFEEVGKVRARIDAILDGSALKKGGGDGTGPASSIIKAV